MGVRFLRRAATAFVALFGASCGPTQGYTGPELPPERVSLVEPEFHEHNHSLVQAVADGFTFSRNGITLLPGKHLFTISVLSKEAPFDCDYYSHFDRSGYRQCLRDAWKQDRDDRRRSSYRSCDCRDYVEVRQRCKYYATDQSCTIEFETKAASAYRLQIRKTGEETSVSATEQERGKSLATEKCIASERRLETEDSHVGTGSHAAIRYGQYCY